MDNQRNQTKKVSASDQDSIGSSRSKVLYSSSLFLLSLKASLSFSHWQQMAGLETNSSYLHRLVSPSSRYTEQQIALSQSPMFTGLALRQLKRSQGLLMFFMYMRILEWVSGEAGKLYQWKGELKVCEFSSPRWVWMGVCLPVLSISNMSLPSHLQQVKVAGSFLEFLTVSQQIQLSSLTVYTQSGTNILQPFLSIYSVRNSRKQYATPMVPAMLMILVQKLQGLGTRIYSCPLTPLRNSLQVGFIDDYLWLSLFEIHRCSRPSFIYQYTFIYMHIQILLLYWVRF